MITRQDAVTTDRFHHGECQLTHGPRGGERRTVEEWRRNGATQTWKRRPEDFRIPVKWGIRSYGQITPDNAAEFHKETDCPLLATEYREVRSDGKTVSVSRWGGGILGKAYEGSWDVKVTDRRGETVLDDVLVTPTPKTHAQVAEQIMEFAAII